MSLITILISLVLERFIGYLDEVRQLDWFRQYGAWLREKLGGIADGITGVVVILIGPALVVWGVTELLDDLLLGLLEIVFGIAVLIYTLGPRDLHSDVEAYMEASAGEDEERIKTAAGHLTGGEPPEDPVERLRAVVGSIFVEANNRMLAVLFWFVILGPMGAVLYRLSHELVKNAEADSNLKRAAEAWLALADWIPARLTALFYALTGHFEDTLPILRRYLVTSLADLPASNRALLREAGTVGVELEESLQEELDTTQVSVIVTMASNMVMRTLVLAVLVLAIGTLGGWIS